MPNDSIGVIVLVVGDHVAPFYNGLTYHIYERLLGMSLTPWSERLNGIRLKNKAAGTQARSVAAVGQVTGTTPSHPLDDYVGEFEHAAYGVVTVARRDAGLAFEFHGIKMPLSHFHYDRFDTPDDEQDGKFSLNFRTNPMGEVDSAEISLDEAAVTFTRRVPAALTTDATLKIYAGTYPSPSGAKVEVAFQPGKGLSIRGPAVPISSPGGPISSASRNSPTSSSPSRSRTARCLRCGSGTRAENSSFLDSSEGSAVAGDVSKSPDRARLAQGRDFFAVEPRLREHFVGVLAELRRAAGHVGWRRAHLDRRAQRPEMPERRVLRLDHHLARQHLRIGEHLRVVVDRPARDVVRLEQRQPVRARLRDGDRFNRVGQRLAIPHPAARCRQMPDRWSTRCGRGRRTAGGTAARWRRRA